MLKILLIKTNLIFLYLGGYLHFFHVYGDYLYTNDIRILLTLSTKILSM